MRARRTRPVEVNAVPWNASDVGNTQSNMSTPWAIASSISGGVPTPIRYRGRW
jgi:hypothetical protein